MKPIIRYFSKIRKLLQLNAERRDRYLWDGQRTFVRTSPLTFPRTVCLVLDLARQTLAVELGRFFGWQSEQLVTKSAFCQRRSSIKPIFFKDLFARTAQYF